MRDMTPAFASRKGRAADGILQQCCDNERRDPYFSVITVSAMTMKKPIQFRAVHTKTRWRRASHESIANALSRHRGAKALFDHLNKAIDYAQHGEPLYVIIWDKRQKGLGEIVKPDHSRRDGLQHAPLPDEEIDRFEAGDLPSDNELEQFFVHSLSSTLENVQQEHTGATSDSEPSLPQPKTAAELECQLQLKIQDSRRITAEARQVRLSLSNPTPVKVEIQTTAFLRSADVIVEVLERAVGKCECCRNPGPFARTSDGTPYLEVHHIVPLSKGGVDSVDNAQALCPNCHRRKHFG